MVHYSVVENTFREDNFGLFFKNNLDHVISFIEQFLRKNNFSEGITIDFLTEAPR